MDEMIQEKVVQKENELNATYDERLRNYEERYVLSYILVLSYLDTKTLKFREQDLQRQISLTKNQLRDLRMSNEFNQAKLLDHSQRQGIPYPATHCCVRVCADLSSMDT
jgi:homeobox protein cut-like